jgi:hypothetical protein
MTTVTRFEELDVWQNAKELTSLIYRLSNSGTFARDFGLRDQMRRAYVTKEEFQSAFGLAETSSRQLASFIRYLESQPNARRLREDGAHYDIQP